MRCTRPIGVYILNATGRKLRSTYTYPDDLPVVLFNKYPEKHQMCLYREALIPCGKCLGCLLDRRAAWTARACLEMLYHEDNCFVTLTYKDDCLPVTELGYPTLYRKHFTDFLKRLRSRLAPRKIRYFGCGEYGSHFDRPHYHAILFGWMPDDLFPWNEGDQIFRSALLEDLWQFGFSTVSPASCETCKYVAGYVGKKIFNKLKPVDVVPCFTACSLKPAIGKEFFEEYGDKLVKFGVDAFGVDFVADHKVRLADGSVMQIPPVFLRWWRDRYPSQHERLLRCNERAHFAEDSDEVLDARETLHEVLFNKSCLKGVTSV